MGNGLRRVVAKIGNAEGAELTNIKQGGKTKVMANKKHTVSETLRAAIEADGRSRYRLCQAAGIDQAAMSRFMAGTRGLNTESVDRLAEALGLELVAKRRPKRAKGR